MIFDVMIVIILEHHEPCVKNMVTIKYFVCSDCSIDQPFPSLSLSWLPYLWPRFPTSVIAWGVFIGTRHLTAESAAFVVTNLRPAEQEEATPERTPSKGFSINSTLASSPEKRTKYSCCPTNVLPKAAVRPLRFSPETLDHNDFSLSEEDFCEKRNQ